MRACGVAFLVALGCGPSPAASPATVAPSPTPQDGPEPSGPAAARADVLPGAQALDAMAWLTGTHRFDTGEMIVEEVWTSPGGGTMYGVSRTIGADGLAAFEFLRIEARGTAIVYIAHPGGRMPGTEFALRPNDEAGTFVFENPEHDFPKRVVYRRIDRIHTQARAEGDDGALVFDFVRVGGDS